MIPNSADITKLSVVALSRALDAGELTAVDVAAAFLERIETRGALRAWAHVDRPRVLDAAKAADKAPRRSPLAGIPVGIKDIMDTFDAPTQYGSPIYAGHQPRADAVLVAQLRAAGCIILGKTITTEFAFRHPNVTVNPHNSAHTPGGSSSGSVAAVADFQAPFATGTQTAGSIIRPAAYCGIVGYKPTFGSLPVAGIKPCAPSLDTPGFFARSVADMALLRRVFVGETGDESPASAPTIGLCRTTSWNDAEPAARRCVEEAGRGFAARGAQVKDVDLPAICDDLLHSHGLIMRYEMHASLSDESLRSSHLLSATMQAALEEACRIPHDRYREALAHVEACRRAVDDLFAGIDALLTLSTAGEAPRGLASTGEPTFNSRWTALYLPCITLPVGNGPAGLPIGVQLVGAHGRESRLLAVAEWAEGRL